MAHRLFLELSSPLTLRCFSQGSKVNELSALKKLPILDASHEVRPGTDPMRTVGAFGIPVRQVQEVPSSQLDPGLLNQLEAVRKAGNQVRNVGFGPTDNPPERKVLHRDGQALNCCKVGIES